MKKKEKKKAISHKGRVNKNKNPRMSNLEKQNLIKDLVIQEKVEKEERLKGKSEIFYPTLVQSLLQDLNTGETETL